MKSGAFEHFTDDELYMLKRQAIESSYDIGCVGDYNTEEKQLHHKLLNAIIDEIKKRDDKLET